MTKPLVVLIDDNDTINFLHTKLLQVVFTDVEIKSFTRADVAFEFLSDNIPLQSHQKVVVLLDINMPIMNGWEFLEEVGKHPIEEHIEVIMVSSSTTIEDKTKAKDFSVVSNYIEKPLDKKKLSILSNIISQN